MNLWLIGVTLIAFGLFSFLWYFAYHIVLACWRPARAKQQWVMIVNYREGLFFTFLKWFGPILLIAYSLKLGQLALTMLGMVRGAAG